MEKEIDYTRLGDIAIELANSILKIKEKEKIIRDEIKKIELNEEYQGMDASMAISKYQTEFNRIEKYIENMENWKDYTKILAGSYKETQEEAIREMETPLEEENEVLNETINMESPIVQEEPIEEVMEEENGYEL